MKGTIWKLTRYALLRAALLALAVVIAVYLTVLIANMGGELDRVREAQIRHDVHTWVIMNPDFKRLPPLEQTAMAEDLIRIQLKALGMDEPFFPGRSLHYLRSALTLNLGRAEFLRSDTHSAQVGRILVERLPTTLLLFGTAELLLFFLTLFMALFLSRRYGSFPDRLTIALAPSSAAPGWFYGIFLILVFAASLRVLPWGGYIGIPIPEATVDKVLSVLKHMVLPVTAIVISAIFSSVYAQRTFFLIYSSEDHVELAKAKGLSSQAVERRHILRPTLPPIITGFLLLVITMWMGQIVLESVFGWPGLGQLYYAAIQIGDTPVIIGVIVIYGYLLAATVFMLDFIYAILDPRVRVGLADSGRR